MQYLGLLAASILAITATAAAPQSQGLLPEDPIRILSATHHIDFPNKIVFAVDVEANVDIDTVTLFYRLGRQDTTIFGYPMFTRASRIKATLAINTSGRSYIPPGVDIEYYYMILDAAGNAFESDRYSLEYKDPSYKWQRFQMEDLIILWHDRPRDQVVELMTGVSSQLRSARQLLGLGSVPTMKAVIVNSTLEASRSFPLVSNAARRGHVYGGFAFGELDVFVLAGLNKDGIIHETVHLLTDEAVGSFSAALPAWLNEGLAMYFETSSMNRETVVSDAARAGRLAPLRTMATVPGRPQDVRVFYAQSRSLVNYMMDSHGQSKMSALLREVDEGMRIEQAIPATYGITLDELDREWRATLSLGATFSPVADPGTLGTSVLISGAAIVALASVLVRWFRSRYKARSLDHTSE